MTAWIIFLLTSIILYSFLKYWAIIPIGSILLGIGLGYFANFRRKENYNLLNNQFSSLVLLDLAAKHQLEIVILSTFTIWTLVEMTIVQVMNLYSIIKPIKSKIPHLPIFKEYVFA
jgi:hypothetical protein